MLTVWLVVSHCPFDGDIASNDSSVSCFRSVAASFSMFKNVCNYHGFSAVALMSTA